MAMPSRVGLTLPGQLASELARVAALRERYQEMQRAERDPPMIAVSLGPVIMMTSAAVDLAIRAFDTGDVTLHVHALQELRGFKD